MIRSEEAAEELHKMLREDELRDAILLVFANKQGFPMPMSVAECTERFRLNELRSRRWYIQASCAVSGDGLYGIHWLSQQLSTSKPSLFERYFVRSVKFQIKLFYLY